MSHELHLSRDADDVEADDDLIQRERDERQMREKGKVGEGMGEGKGSGCRGSIYPTYYICYLKHGHFVVLEIMLIGRS